MPACCCGLVERRWTAGTHRRAVHNYLPRRARPVPADCPQGRPLLAASLQQGGLPDAWGDAL